MGVPKESHKGPQNWAGAAKIKYNPGIGAHFFSSYGLLERVTLWGGGLSPH